MGGALKYRVSFEIRQPLAAGAHRAALPASDIRQVGIASAHAERTGGTPSAHEAPLAPTALPPAQIADPAQALQHIATSLFGTGTQVLALVEQVPTAPQPTMHSAIEQCLNALDLTAGTDTYKIPILMRTLGSMFEEAEMDPERLSQYDGYQKFINRLRLEIKLFSHAKEKSHSSDMNECTAEAFKQLSKFEPEIFVHEAEVFLEAQLGKRKPSERSTKDITGLVGTIIDSNLLDTKIIADSDIPVILQDLYKPVQTNNTTTPSYPFPDAGMMNIAFLLKSCGKKEAVKNILTTLFSKLAGKLANKINVEDNKEDFKSLQSILYLLSSTLGPEQALTLLSEQLKEQEIQIAKPYVLLFKALSHVFSNEILSRQIALDFNQSDPFKNNPYTQSLTSSVY